MPVLLTGPAQLYVQGTTSGSSVNATVTELKLIGEVTQFAVQLSETVGNLTTVLCRTTGAMAALTTTWANGGTEPALPGYNCPPSPEQAEQWLREQEEYGRRRARATVRARELLLTALDDEQARSYTERGFIELQGSAGGWWRIRRDGQAGNVEELKRPGGPAIATWCCHPPDCLPDPDAHLAQLLHLATDEPGFRKTGNRRSRLLAA